MSYFDGTGELSGKAVTVSRVGGLCLYCVCMQVHRARVLSQNTARGNLKAQLNKISFIEEMETKRNEVICSKGCN